VGVVDEERLRGDREEEGKLWADIGAEGAVERAPDVVKGVRSRISGIMTMHEFLAAKP